MVHDVNGSGRALGRMLRRAIRQPARASTGPGYANRPRRGRSGVPNRPRDACSRGVPSPCSSCPFGQTAPDPGVLGGEGEHATRSCSGCAAGSPSTARSAQRTRTSPGMRWAALEQDTRPRVGPSTWTSLSGSGWPSRNTDVATRCRRATGTVRHDRCGIRPARRASGVSERVASVDRTSASHPGRAAQRRIRCRAVVRAERGEGHGAGDTPQHAPQCRARRSVFDVQAGVTAFASA